VGISEKKETNGIDQSPEIDPHQYGQLIWNKGKKAT
jgi:hypothetical protein